MKAHVLSVGQCSADEYRLAQVLNVEANAHVDRASTAAEARRLMAEHPYDLILVNRIIDGDGASGIDFIGQTLAAPGAPPTPRMMLISDLPEAQAAARVHGAVPGFGKEALGTPEIGQRLREALHSCSRAGSRQEPPAPKAETPHHK